MDLTYSAEDEAFRQEVRDFIDEAFTPDIRRECERSKNGYITKQSHITWQKRLYERVGPPPTGRPSMAVPVLRRRKNSSTRKKWKPPERRIPLLSA